MTRRGFLARLLGIVGLLVLTSEPLSAQIGLEEVTSLRFQGNRSFSDEALASSILTRETECRSFILLPFCLVGADFSRDPYYLTQREFRFDFVRVHAFYLERGYREVSVDTVVTRPRDGEVELTFLIDEGEPVRIGEIEFRIDGQLPDSSVLENLPVRIGEPLSTVALDAARDTLETRLRNRGFPHVDVLRNYDLPRGSYEAQVAFDVYPGPVTRFGPITVDISAADGGLPTVDESVVRRMLPFREGNLYEEDLQRAGQRNLFNLDIFRFVNFLPDSLSPVDSILPLTVQAQEGDIHRVRTGGGLNTAECFNFEASWHSRNFFGGARRLQLTGRVANVLASTLESTILCSEAGEDEYGELSGSVSADFSQPWFFSPRNAISANVFVERQSIAPIFVRETVGMNLGLNRTVAISTLVGFSYGPQFTRLAAAEVFFCSAYLICAPEEIALLQRANWLAPVGITFSQDRRNQALSPTRGYSALIDLEHASDWTGSDFRYTRVISEATWYTQGRTQWVFGARLRGGWIDPQGFRGLESTEGSREIIHPQKRLFAGGSNSVRGYAQNRLGPRVLYLENVEALYADRDDGPLCTRAEVADLSCDPGGLPDGQFVSSPTGGTKLLEGSLEIRFPIAGELWEGATFLDFGQVWDEDASPRLGDLEFTPGMGIRYFSPIGPIRVDMGYRFGAGERLAVVTKRMVPDATAPEGLRPGDDVVVLNTPVSWGGGLGPWDVRRFQIHLSIGQAF